MSDRPGSRTRSRWWRQLAVLAVTVMFASGCAALADSDTSDEPDERILVVTDFNVLAEFVQQVGGDRVAVDPLVPLGGDPHVYEPRPGDAMAVNDADLVLEHGLGLSPWMEGMRSHAQGRTAVVGDQVAELAVTDDDGLLDPHLWLVPPIAAEYATAIEELLTEVDPDGADEYAEGADRFRRELAELDEELMEAFSSVAPEDRWLVTPHDAYRYFADHFGLQVLGTLVGTTTEEQPSARRMRELIDEVEQADVPAIFVESTVPPEMIERVAREAGADVAGPLYADSLGAPGSDADTYTGMLRHNARTIVEALGGEWP